MKVCQTVNIQARSVTSLVTGQDGSKCLLNFKMPSAATERSQA